MADITAWHGRTLDEHIKLRDDAAKTGYRFLSLSLYGSASSPVYAAVMIRRPVLVAQHDWPLMTANEFQQTFDAQAKLGYGPVLIAATGSVGDPRFAAIWFPDTNQTFWNADGVTESPSTEQPKSLESTTRSASPGAFINSAKCMEGR